jgi:hypothetical protein
MKTLFKIIAGIFGVILSIGTLGALINTVSRASLANGSSAAGTMGGLLFVLLAGAASYGLLRVAFKPSKETD